MKIRVVILCFVFVYLTLAPNIASASWWNPFTWHKPEVKTVKIITLTPETKKSVRFYIKDTANIRSCASINCEIVNVFKKGQYVDFPSQSNYSLQSLPDWVSVSWYDSEKLKYGYIYKTLLTDKEIELEQEKSTEEDINESGDIQNVNIPPVSLDDVNSLYSELKSEIDKFDNLPICGGKKWKQCPSSTSFYCDADGSAHCKNISSIQPNESSALNNSPKTTEMNEMTRNRSIIESLEQNGSLEENWRNNKICAEAENSMDNDPSGSLTTILKYCVRKVNSYDIPLIQRTVCLGGKYDSVSSSLLLQGCKNW